MIKKVSNILLFEEPDISIERQSEWDDPKGFMFGGMSTLTETNLSQVAEQYFRAANALLLIIKRNDVADYELQNPVFYLFRQCMELMVKANLMGEGKSLLDSKNRNIHSLKVLLDRLGNVPSDYYSLIEQLHEIDPASTLLRYGGDKPFFNGEMWCSLGKLEFQMNRLYNYLKKRYNK
jgi:hypothetical protein